jgi:transcriptional antiterminator NusG
MDQGDAKWYAISTRTRYEHLVFRQLRSLQIEAFLPTISRWSRWKDRRKKIDWPLFDGYCFGRFHAANRLSVLTCTGVRSIVSQGGRAGGRA